jgi:2,4-dienoyl-CoA reductase-like NADH-dependent reductase (Old Yellow Enzyme family)
MGIWSDDHIEQLAGIVRFIHQQGSVAEIQLAHAGRKGSPYRPWDRYGAVPEGEGGWSVMAPSALAFGDHYAVPVALTEEGIRNVVTAFAEAARRACDIGFGSWKFTPHN